MQILGKLRRQRATPNRNKDAPVVLVCAVYDRVTAMMKEWIEELDLSPYLLLDGEAVENRELIRLFDDTEEVAVIFLGHGLDNQLNGCRDGSSFLQANDISSSKIANIFAYCCYSSRQLGRYVRTLRSSNRYIGYLDQLNFVVDCPVCKKAMGEPVQALLSSICDGGFHDSTDFLVAEYEMALEKCHIGEYSKADMSFMACLCLEDHLSVLDSTV